MRQNRVKPETCGKVMGYNDDAYPAFVYGQCDLPKGHSGPHAYRYESETNGKVVTTFEKALTILYANKLRHIIPVAYPGCRSPDGLHQCPFLARVHRDDFVSNENHWDDLSEGQYECYLNRQSPFSSEHVQWFLMDHDVTLDKGCDDIFIE